MSEQNILYFSRRQLLLGAGSIGLLTSTYSIYQQLGSYQAVKLGLRSLSDKETAIYRYIGAWMLPNSEYLPGNGGDDETIRRIDLVLADVPAGKRWLFSALVFAFEHGTAIDNFGSKALTRLPPAAGDKYLTGWAESKSLIPTQLFAALKAIYSFSYFERPDVIAAMGMKAPCEVYQ